MIEVRDLTKIYPGAVALDHATFSIERGEIIGFLGPNGAGKSTTMRILTGFIPPTSGLARVAGFDVVRDSFEVRKRIGYLPENNPLYTEMRVREYLLFRSKIKRVPGPERRKRVDEALDRCGIKDVAHRIIGHLSKGYRQRVGLADAIVHGPELIILDEPTIGLDPNQIRHVRKLIRELGEKRTVLLSTHILSEVEVMCRRVIIISRGKIVASGTPDEIVTQLNLLHRVRMEVRPDGAAVTAEQMKEEIQNVDGVEVVHIAGSGETRTFLIHTKDHTDIRENLYRLAVQKKWTVRELALQRGTLEDAFVELTQGGRS